MQTNTFQRTYSALILTATDAGNIRATYCFSHSKTTKDCLTRVVYTNKDDIYESDFSKKTVQAAKELNGAILRSQIRDTNPYHLGVVIFFADSLVNLIESKGLSFDTFVERSYELEECARTMLGFTYAPCSSVRTADQKGLMKVSAGFMNRKSRKLFKEILSNV